MNATGLKTILKLSGGALGLLALLAVLVAFNIITDNVHVRKDMTEDKIFTLSEGTRNIIRKLDSPVTLKLFFTRSSPDVPVPLKSFAQQVEDLLKEYRLAGKGKIVVEIYDPEPDSEAEEWAERYGLSGQSPGMLDAPIYCGLVTVKGDVHEVIPFIDPRSEELLEYNITRMISRVATPRKPVLGVMSSLPVMGVRTFPYSIPGQPPPRNQPRWAAFQDLGGDYEVRQVPAAAEKIDQDISVIILVHPKNLTDKTLYALDQFVLNGGRLLAFLDPLCMYEAMNPDPAGDRSRPFSEITRLTDAWGIKHEPDKVVADLQTATQVRRSDNSVDNSPLFLSLRQNNIDGQDVITASLESLILPAAGVFSGTGAEGLALSSLLTTSPQSQPVNTMMAQMGSEAIRRDFQPGLKKMNLALRLQGKFKTAFPEGAPKDAEAADKKDKEPKAEDTALPGLKESSKPSAVILVGDVDMLYDAFAVQDLSMLGIKGHQPVNDNINFLVNAVDQLAGSADLASIRSRGRFDRPFDRVIALQQVAQEKWLMQERALQKQLESTRERLEALQSQKDKNQKYILSPEQQEEIKRFREEQMKTQRELKQVRKNLREGIEELGIKVKLINILLAPALVAAAGLIFAWRRRFRTKNA